MGISLIPSLFILCESVKVLKFLPKYLHIYIIYYTFVPDLYIYINKHALYPEDIPKIPRR